MEIEIKTVVNAFEILSDAYGDVRANDLVSLETLQDDLESGMELNKLVDNYKSLFEEFKPDDIKIHLTRMEQVADSIGETDTRRFLQLSIVICHRKMAGLQTVKYEKEAEELFNKINY